MRKRRRGGGRGEGEDGKNKARYALPSKGTGTGSVFAAHRPMASLGSVGIHPSFSPSCSKREKKVKGKDEDQHPTERIIGQGTARGTKHAATHLIVPLGSARVTQHVRHPNLPSPEHEVAERVHLVQHERLYLALLVVRPGSPVAPLRTNLFGEGGR